MACASPNVGPRRRGEAGGDLGTVLLRAGDSMVGEALVDVGAVIPFW